MHEAAGGVQGQRWEAQLATTAVARGWARWAHGWAQWPYPRVSFFVFFVRLTMADNIRQLLS